jgi:hypothetical protein
MTEQVTAPASLSDILLSYDWSPVTRGTIETLGVSIPLATPAIPTPNAVVSAFVALDESNAKAAEAYAKALEAIAAAEAKVKATREALETKAGHTVADVSALLAEKSRKECAEHRLTAKSKADFLAQLVNAVPLDDAEVTAAKAVIEYAKAKLTGPVVRGTGSGNAPSLRDKLQRAGYAVGDRGRISAELQAIAERL